MKRILFINPVPTISGAESSLLKLMIRLNREKYEPVLLCRENGPLPRRCEENGISTIFCHSLPVPGKPAWHTFRSMPFNGMAIASIARRHGIDLIHCNSPRSAYYGGLAARLANIPSFIHVRDYLDSPFRSKPKARLLGFLSDRILVVSHAVEKAIMEWASFLSNKVMTIYNGIEEGTSPNPLQVSCLRNEWTDGQKGPILAVIGIISRMKGFGVALDALPKVLDQYPSAKLIFVGEARDVEGLLFLEELHSKVQSLGIKCNVTFAGYRSDISVVLNSIDILIHPATLPDAFPHVLLEACMQGTLVVGSDIGGISEIIQENKTGRLVKPNNPDALANTLLQCLEDPENSERLKQSGREYVMSHFPMKQYVDRIQDVYTELLNR